MGVVGRGVDALGVYLSGGTGNSNPALSLGGTASSTRVRGLGALVSNPIPAIRVDYVFPACGEGSASLSSDGAGNFTFTPPDGSPGSPVAVAPGATAVLAGSDPNKAVVVTREAGLVAGVRTSTLSLVRTLDGVFSHGNVSSSARAAGATTYRAVVLAPRGPYVVLGVRAWLPWAPTLQSQFALGFEPADGPVQVIPNEATAPIGVSWSSPTSRDAGIALVSLVPGSQRGLWVRRKFPAGGRVAVEEKLYLSVAYQGV